MSIDAVSQKTAIPTAEVTVNRQGFVAGFTGDVSTLIDLAMTAPVGQLKGPIEVGDGAVAFQVVEQKKVDPQELAKNREQYIDTLRQQQVRNLRSVLLQRLKKDAKIQINEAILRPQTTDTAPGV